MQDNSIPKLIKNGFCIGCGNCAAYDSDLYVIRENEYGVLESSSLKSVDNSTAAEVCPFLNSEKNEDYFNDFYKNESLEYDPGVGFYRNVYAGYLNDSARRVASSSGGLTTFLLEQMLVRGLVDGALVVSAVPESGGRLGYIIARTVDELRASRKSKYHMVSHDSVINDVLGSGEGTRFAYVGIPCGVKSIKLLSEKNPALKDKIKYTIAIFCGHQKSHAFSEYVAWQTGIVPSDLRSINYRVKEPADNAAKYFYEVASSAKTNKIRVDDLKWLDWGLGLFKPRACDFCDDVAGEAADIIFGDAWDRKYSRDYRGTNIVISRSKVLENILLDGSKTGEITLNQEGKDFIYATQGGNFRHRQGGLSTRLKLYQSLEKWTPPKSKVRLERYHSDPKRSHVYLLRHRISEKSHSLFLTAKNAGCLDDFWSALASDISTYYKSTKVLSQRIKSFIRSCERRMLSFFRLGCK